jgi:hypothetical protein
MSRSLSNWFRSLVAGQPYLDTTTRVRLSVESLHDRITPAFTVNLYGGIFAFFQGSAGGDAITLSTSANGLLRHDLPLGENLVSPTDLDAIEPGEQSLSLLDTIRSASTGVPGTTPSMPPPFPPGPLST